MPGLLRVGLNNVVTQNVVYALPAKRCLLYCDTAATLLQSSTEAFTVSTAVTLTNGQAELAGGFLKCTSAGPVNVSLKI